MQKKRTYGLILILLISSSMTVLAQSAREDFAKIGSAYKNLKSVSIDINYALYANHKTARAQEEKIGTTVISKNLYYNKFEEVEILRDKSLAVVADPIKKLLILQPAKMRKKDKVLPVDIDSELKSYKSVDYKKLGDHSAQYTMTLKKGKMERLVLEFNTTSYLIENIVIFYKSPIPESGQDKTPPRVEIKYGYHPISDKEVKEFSVKKYFTVSRGKYKPKGSYKTYEFVNRLNK